MSDLLTLSQELTQSGISVIPIRPDGSKGPDGKYLPRDDEGKPTWKPFQSQIADEATRRLWFANNRKKGVAAVCGKISGNLEDLDIDEARLFKPFCKLVQEHDGGPELLRRLVIIKTPRPGWALVYRCSAVEGNQKLAQRPGADGKPKAIFETRGEGGYFLLPGCPAVCHELRKPYVLRQGDLMRIPTVTPEEREILLSCARVFDEMPHEPRKTIRAPSSPNGNRPGDEFGARTDWGAILVPHGWKRIYARGEAEYWRRPGKKVGWSASTNYRGSDVLHVFSTSAAPFEADANYDKFATFAFLDHNGDFRAAARALAAAGFGSKREAPYSEPGPEPSELPPIDESQAFVKSEPSPSDKAKPKFAEESKSENPFAPPAHWQLLDVANITEWDCPELRWIIEGIIALANLVWVAAESQVGKTLLGLYIAERMLRGGKLFGKFQVTPVKRLLYLALEDPARRVKARILDMMREGDPPLESGQFMLYVAPGLRLNDDLAFAWLEQFLRQEKFEVVFLDTYQRATPGVSSFDDEKQSLMIHRLVDLTRRLGVALWTNDHFRKAQEGKRRKELNFDAIKGTVGKQVNADCIILMERDPAGRIAVSVQSKETDQKLGFLLEVSKQGDKAKPKFTHVADFDVLADRSRAKAQKTRETIVKALQGISWISSVDLAKNVKLHRTTVKRQLDFLVKEQIVESEGEGNLTRYRISDASQKTAEMHLTGTSAN